MLLIVTLILIRWITGMVMGLLHPASLPQEHPCQGKVRYTTLSTAHATHAPHAVDAQDLRPEASSSIAPRTRCDITGDSASAQVAFEAQSAAQRGLRVQVSTLKGASTTRRFHAPVPQLRRAE